MSQVISRTSVFVLAALSTVLLSLDDFLQQWLTEASNYAEIEWNFVLTVYVLSLAMWTANIRWINNSILAVFGLFSAVQLSNIAYFGQPLNPADLPNLFADAGEVWQTGAASFSDHWLVLICVLLPYGLLIWLHNRFNIECHSGWRWLSLILIVAILASKPIRATERSMSFFMAGPTRSSLHNSLNAWSFYLTHLNSSDTVIQSDNHQPYDFSYNDNKAAHIWLVVADSLPSQRLSAYGYPRDNSPNLRQRVESGEMLTKRGIAAGVSTIVSLSNMINLSREPAQQALLSNHHNNIYKHAKQQGYQTLWLSSQESKLLSFLGARFIDIKTTREDHPLLFAKRGDLGLLDIIDQQDWSQPSFAVINLRTVHSPYAANYDGLMASPPWDDSAELERFSRENNSYDNAVFLLDQSIDALVEAFKKLPGEGYLIFTGDHGQFLGEDNRWGHNKLEPQVIDVPIMILAKHADLNTELTQRQWLSHYEMMVWIAAKMGININNPNNTVGQHFVKGSKLLGDNTILSVTETNTGLHYGKPQLISEWLQQKQ